MKLFEKFPRINGVVSIIVGAVIILGALDLITIHGHYILALLGLAIVIRGFIRMFGTDQ